jgi:predicted nucleotidyltransferase component of viral defense system
LAHSYYRLSEDLDFSLELPSGTVTRSMRRNTIKPIKDKIQTFAKGYGLSVEGIETAGHRESTQYIYYVNYDSAIVNKQQSIKIEIGLRFNPLLPTSKRNVQHRFLHPFTNEPLFEGGSVKCLALKELVAEKMRAAATRAVIAPRDFYDLDYLHRAGFDFRDKELPSLFQRKLAEDGFTTDLKRYRVNMGRSESEVRDMRSRIEAELLDVLTLEEKTAFNLHRALNALNDIFKR